jgi:ribonuclease-3
MRGRRVSHVIEERLAYQFRNPDLLDTALTHRSLAPTGGTRNNEKLEFLGDAVLDLVISDLLMRQFPRHQEGDLSKLRASLVNARVLAEKARGLGLGQALHLGKGEEKSGGREKESILAAGYEALLGAIYLDRGFVAARRVLARQFAADLQARATGAVEDCKTRLQEITQRIFKTTPTYTLVRETGPDHAKHFVSQISVGERTFGRGEGRSKKSAEQAAAMEALHALQVEAAALAPPKALRGEATVRAVRKGASGTGGER